MVDFRAYGDRSELLTPESLVDHLPSRPLMTNPADSWDGIVLQRFQHPPAAISVHGMRDNLLVAYMSGQVLVEDDRGDGEYERRWTGPGQVTLTPAGRPVDRILRGRPDVVLVHLAPGLLQEVAMEFDGRDPDEEATIVRCFATPDSTADRLVRLLLAEAEAPGPATLLMAGLLARALAVHLLRFHSPRSPRSLESRDALPPPRLRIVLERMRASFDEDLTLGRLAALAGLSPSHFARSFRQATGESPHRYLIGLRIERARSLLETTDLPIIEVGLRCRFDGPSHFATAFRKVTGHSPRAWRLLRRS